MDNLYMRLNRSIEGKLHTMAMYIQYERFPLYLYFPITNVDILFLNINIPIELTPLPRNSPNSKLVP